MADLENLLSLQEAAEKVHVKPKTIRMWMTQGRLQRTKVGGRTLVERAELERFIAACNGVKTSETDLRPAA